MPYDKSPMEKSSCIKMYDDKGKQTGLMMEGSVAHMESVKQERENLEGPDGYNAVDDKASAMEMSPYKFTGMSGGSAVHNEDKKMKDLPLGSRARYEEYRRRNWKHDETSLGKKGADNKIDLRDWQESGNPEDIQYRMPRK